jgi:hypothetical protein
MECLEMCIMEIVASVHFVYSWHPNKISWNVNELKTLIMDNSNIKLLECLDFSNNNRSITIQDSSLVDHPLQGVVECRGWARMKWGDEHTFGVTKNIGYCDWQLTTNMQFIMKWMTEVFTKKESSLQNNVPTSSLGVHRSKNLKFHRKSWKHTTGCWLFLSPQLLFAGCLPPQNYYKFFR